MAPKMKTHRVWDWGVRCETEMWGVRLRCETEVWDWCEVWGVRLWCEVWGWGVRCETEVWDWGVRLRCETEVWDWGVRLRCETEVWDWCEVWGVRLWCEVWGWGVRCETEVWGWGVRLRCDNEVWDWGVRSEWIDKITTVFKLEWPTECPDIFAISRSFSRTPRMVSGFGLNITLWLLRLFCRVGLGSRDFKEFGAHQRWYL